MFSVSRDGGASGRGVELRKTEQWLACLGRIYPGKKMRGFLLRNKHFLIPQAGITVGEWKWKWVMPSDFLPLQRKKWLISRSCLMYENGSGRPFCRGIGTRKGKGSAYGYCIVRAP